MSAHAETPRRGGSGLPYRWSDAHESNAHRLNTAEPPPCRSCGLPLSDRHVVSRSRRWLRRGALSARCLFFDLACECGDRQRIMWGAWLPGREEGR